MLKFAVIAVVGLSLVACGKKESSDRQPAESKTPPPASGSQNQEVNEKTTLQQRLTSLTADKERKEGELERVLAKLDSDKKARDEIENQSGGGGGIVQTIGSIAATDEFKEIASGVISPTLAGIISGIGKAVSGTGGDSASSKQLEDALDEIEEDIEKLEEDQDDLERDIDSLEAQIAEAQAKLDALP